jgi:SAM-dependent methyltransferase
MLTYSKNKQRGEELYDPSVKTIFVLSESYLGFLDSFIDWQKKNNIDIRNKQGLDAGCGLGANALLLADMGINMIGLDYSGKAIERASNLAAKTKNRNKVSFLEHDLTKKLPVKERSVDFVFDIFTTSCIKGETSRELALSNMISVLKKGGYLITTQVYIGYDLMAKEVEDYPGDEKSSTFERGEGPQTKVYDSKELLSLYQHKLTQVIYKKLYPNPRGIKLTHQPVYLFGIFKNDL